MSAASIPFKLTAAGIDAAFNLGAVNLQVTHVQIGNGNATPSGAETALVSPKESATISGHFEVSAQQHRIAAIIAGSAEAYNISEIGLWSGAPGAGGSVLVFYWSQPAGYIAVKSASVDFNFETDMYFGGVVPSNITIIADTQFNALAMLTAHVAETHPHTQYIPHYNTGIALPTSNIGPIWHDDYGAFMIWNSLTSNYKALIGGYGQCVLSKDGANLRLLPRNGSKLVINGKVKYVPSAGITLPPSGLTPSTLYYIYAWMADGVMTLEASTTGHSMDVSTGVEIKTGDATRTLVGMARPIAGPAWADTENQRFVRSWFNDDGIYSVKTFASARSTTSSTPIESNSADRVEFLVWNNESVFCTASSAAFNSIVGGQSSIRSVIDGVTNLIDAGLVSQSTSNATTIGTLPMSATLGEGYHYASVFIWQNGGGTASYLANSGISVWS